MTNERGIEPVLQSSTATIYSKAMKPAEYITNDVNKPRDWSYVESVVNHLTKSLSKGIRVDLVIKYGVKCFVVLTALAPDTQLAPYMILTVFESLDFTPSF